MRLFTSKTIVAMATSLAMSCALDSSFQSDSDCQGCDGFGDNTKESVGDLLAMSIEDSPTTVQTLMAVGAIVPRDFLGKTKESLRDELKATFPNKDICESVPFLDAARTPISCSGFLISKNHFVTAAHSLEEDFCNNNVITFDNFFDESALQLDEHSVFNCEKIEFVGTPDYPSINTSKSKEDFAIVKMSTPVDNRVPVRLDLQPTASGTNIIQFGHPKGLPLMFARGTIQATSYTDESYQSLLDGDTTEAYREKYFDSWRLLTQGLLPHNALSMKGDSGGPLLTTTTQHAVGMHSQASLLKYKKTQQDGWIPLKDFESDFYFSEAQNCVTINNCSNDDLFCSGYNHAVELSQYKAEFVRLGIPIKE